MKDQKNKYEDFEDFLIEEEKKLDIVYKELLKNNENKNAINKFDRIVKSKIDYRGLLPCSKSYEGESLLTLSKTWMIIILIKITKGKSQQEQFLQLVNSSLTHELNEYDQYKEFYEEQCELIFSDDEALKQINLNPRMQTKLDNSVTHDELKNYYIYLLFRPKYFQKTDLDGIQKIKRENSDEKKNRKSEKNNKRLKENKITNKTRKSNNSFTISISDEFEEEYEKGDRLNEKDMISKNRAKEPSHTYGAKNKDKSNSNRNNKQKNEKNDPDYNIIDGILNNTKKKEEKKKNEKKKKSSNYNDDLDDNSENTGDIVIEIHNEEDKEDKKGKKNKNQKRKTLNDKKIRKNKKYEDELDEEWVEQEIEKKRNKNKNQKDKKQKDEENVKKDKKGKKEEKPKKGKNNRASTDKIFALLGINPDEVKEEEEEKTDTKTLKGRQSVSLPKSNKKDKKEKGKEKEKVKEKPKNKDKNKKGEDNNKDKKKNKEKVSVNKKGSSNKKGGKQKKVKKSKSDDDDDNFSEEDEYDDDNFINSLSKLNQTSDNDSYGDDIDKMDEKDRKEIEKEIKALVNGDLEDIDIDGLLEGSNIEGISLNSFNSKSSGDIDIDEEDN